MTQNTNLKDEKILFPEFVFKTGNRNRVDEDDKGV